MPIPVVVHIAGHLYSVERLPRKQLHAEVGDKDALGAHCGDRLRILVADDAPYSIQAQVFLHEVVHAWEAHRLSLGLASYDTRGEAGSGDQQRLQEMFVNNLAQAIWELGVDNPGLMTSLWVDPNAPHTPRNRRT